MYGFTFDDTHCSNFNILMKSDNRSLLPTKRIKEEKVIGRHGTYKFEDAYNDRPIKTKCTLLEVDLTERRRMAREIAEWLSVEGPLIFDDEPYKYYTARLDKQINLKIDTVLDLFDLNFICEPFAYSTFLNDNVPYDLEVDNDLLEGLKTTFNATSNTNVKVSNLGTYEALPVIEVDGTADTVIIGSDGQSFSLQNVTEKVYIDSKNMIVYTLDNDGNKINKILDHTGDFIKLQKGLNDISIEGTNLNVSVFFNFRNTYL